MSTSLLKKFWAETIGIFCQQDRNGIYFYSCQIIIIIRLQRMTHISAYIGQAALHNFFPQLANQVKAYNPQFNGWETADDMPKYNNAHKNKIKIDYLKEGERLNVQLMQHIFKPDKPTQEKKKQQLPNNLPNQNTKNYNTNQNNHQYYNKPIPYHQPQQKPKTQRNSKPQYNIPYNAQMYSQPNQGWPGNTSYYNPYQYVAPTYQNYNQNQYYQSHHKQNSQTQNNKEQNNLVRKHTAEEMDSILGG